MNLQVTSDLQLQLPKGCNCLLLDSISTLQITGLLGLVGLRADTDILSCEKMCDYTP